MEHSARMIQWLLLTVLYSVTIVSAKHEVIHSCRASKGNYTCHKLATTAAKKIQFPDNACYNIRCDHCLKRQEVKILLSDFTLLEPTKIWIRQVLNDSGTSIMWQCMDSQKKCSCSKEKPCSGNTRFCELFPFDNQSNCFCMTRRAFTDFIHYDDKEAEIINPEIIKYQTCVFKRDDSSKRIARSMRYKRTLLNAIKTDTITNNAQLEDGEDIWSHKDIKLTFVEPVFTANTKGIMILRKNGVQEVVNVTDSLQVIIPPDFLIQAGEMEFVFVIQTGSHIKGVIQLSGDVICTQITCFMCWDIFKKLHCLPPSVKYSVYSITIVILTVGLYYMKKMIKLLWSMIATLGCVVYQIYRLVRMIAKLSLWKGATTGQKLKTAAEVLHANLQRQANMNVNLALISLMLIMTVQHGNTTCTENLVISSTQFNCIRHNDLEQCLLKDHFQVTLNNLQYQACLWLNQKETDKTIELRIKLTKATAHWTTKLSYYTVKTDFKYVQNYKCNFGEECRWLTTCQDNADYYPDMPTDYQQLMGFNGCIGVDSVGSRCLLISYYSCLFYRIGLMPDYKFQYEVRKIISSAIQYTLEVNLVGNITKTIQVSGGQYIDDGIFLEVLGSYQQPTIHPERYLIVRTADRSDAYLDNASEPGRMVKGTLGTIQMNESLATNFLFLKDEFNCQALQQEIVCSRDVPYLHTMIETKDTALPRTEAFHHFQVDENGNLISELLATQPVQLALKLTNYKVSLITTKVCPKFTDTQITVTGFYPTKVLASLQFEAFSGCEGGMTTVKFETITVATRSIQLLKEKSLLTIQFHSESQCGSDRLCLSAGVMTQCKQFKFCLETGELLLRQPNISYGLGADISKWSGEGWTFSNLFTGVLNFGKTIQYAIVIFIIGLGSIFCISCCTTLFKR